MDPTPWVQFPGPSQPSITVTPVPGHQIPSSELCRPQTHTDKTLKHIKEIKIQKQIKPKSANAFQVLGLQTFTTKTKCFVALLLFHVTVVLSAWPLLSSSTQCEDDPWVHRTQSH